MVVDGVAHAPLVTDTTRSRFMVFDFAGRAVFQQMDDTFVFYGAQIDQEAGTLMLARGGGNGAPSGKLTFTRPSSDVLEVAGIMDGHNIEMRLRLFDYRHFLLLSRGFKWVQEYPFIR